VGESEEEREGKGGGEAVKKVTCCREYVHTWYDRASAAHVSQKRNTFGRFVSIPWTKRGFRGRKCYAEAARRKVRPPIAWQLVLVIATKPFVIWERKEIVHQDYLKFPCVTAVLVLYASTKQQH
jgi:hypothetical protein